jgi:hypothetical protein
MLVDARSLSSTCFSISRQDKVAIDVQASTANWSSPFHAFLVPVFGTLAILLVGIGVSEFAAILRPPAK